MSTATEGRPGAPPAWAGPDRPWLAPVTTGALAVLGSGALALVDPGTTGVPLCPLKAVTGLDCPFCGSLRAVHALTRLDLTTALDHNVLFTVAVPILVVAWVVWLLRSLGRPALPRLVLPASTGPALLALAVVFGIARNLPALSWLASRA